MVFDSDSEDDFAPPPAAAADHHDSGEAATNVYAAYNAYYDEEVESDSSRDAPQFAPQNDGDSAGEHENAEPAQARPGNAGKRRRQADVDDNDDDDFESQQSILKWVRTVPGPLQDVMKNQQATLDAENSGQFVSGGSMGSGAMISTVFDDGSWVDMCEYLRIPTTRGKLYGGIRMSSLKHTLSYILEDDQSSPKIPKLLLLIKSMKYVDEEIVALFHDPTGEIEGYFHRDIVEQLGPALGAGTGVLLRQVSVFTPTDATSVGRRKSYLNIIPRNLQRVFLPKSQVSSYGATVDTYNKERAALVEVEVTNDETNRAQEAEEQRLLQHDALRHASTELSYLSQRQVVHRNPPVRLDPSEAATEGGGKGKSKKSKKKDESSSGLGKWQWNQLVKRKSTNANSSAPSRTVFSNGGGGDSNVSSSASQLLPTSRFTALLSRQIATKRRSSDSGLPGSAIMTIDEDDEDQGDEGNEPTEGNRIIVTSSRVRFAASPVVVEISAVPAPGSADVSENEEVFLNEDSTPQPAAVTRHQSPVESPLGISSFGRRANDKEEEVDEEEDDDDW